MYIYIYITPFLWRLSFNWTKWKFCVKYIQKKHKKNKSHDRNHLLNSKFSDKCKKRFPQNFRRSSSTTKIYWMSTNISFLWSYLHNTCFALNLVRKMLDLSALNAVRTTRALIMYFYIVIQVVRFLFGSAKYLLGSAEFCLWKR